MSIARRIKITGRVQGVFFRAWTQEQANDLGLVGWVRNCSDGSVEAHVEGNDEAVTQLIEKIGEGPPGARVDHVEVRAAHPEGQRRFDVRR